MGQFQVSVIKHFGHAPRIGRSPSSCIDPFPTSVRAADLHLIVQSQGLFAPVANARLAGLNRARTEPSDAVPAIERHDHEGAVGDDERPWIEAADDGLLRQGSDREEKLERAEDEGEDRLLLRRVPGFPKGRNVGERVDYRHQDHRIERRLGEQPERNCCERREEEVPVGRNHVGKPRLMPGTAGDAERNHRGDAGNPAAGTGAVGDLGGKGNGCQEPPKEPCEGMRLHTVVIHAPQVWNITDQAEGHGGKPEQLRHDRQPAPLDSHHPLDEQFLDLRFAASGRELASPRLSPRGCCSSGSVTSGRAATDVEAAHGQLQLQLMARLRTLEGRTSMVATSGSYSARHRVRPAASLRCPPSRQATPLR